MFYRNVNNEYKNDNKSKNTQIEGKQSVSLDCLKILRSYNCGKSAEKLRESE